MIYFQVNVPCVNVVRLSHGPVVKIFEGDLFVPMGGIGVFVPIQFLVVKIFVCLLLFITSQHLQDVESNLNVFCELAP